MSGTNDASAHLSALLETIRDGVLAFEAVRGATGELLDFGCTLASDRVTEHLGGAPTDRVGRRLSALGPPLDALFETCSRVVATGTPERCVFSSARDGDLAREALLRPVGDGVLVVLSDVPRAASARFAALLDGLPANITLHRGAAHEFTHSNRAHQITSGDRALVGRSLIEAMPELAGQGLVERLDTVLATGQPVQSRAVPVVVSDGTGQNERFYDVAWQPLFGRDGRPEGVATFSYEVTELVAARQRAEALAESLGASESLFRVSQEVSPAGFSYHRVIRDAAGAVVDLEWVYQNAAASRLNHLGPDREAAGTRMLEVFPALRHDPLWAHFRGVAETGEPWRGEVFYGGEHFDQWFRITAVRAQEGVAVTFEDITDRKADEAERARLLERVEAARAEAARESSRLEMLVSEAPVAIAVSVGEDLAFQIANDRYERMVGRYGLRGRAFRDVFPELAPDAPVVSMLRNVLETGEAFTADEYPVSLDRGDGVLEERFFQFTSQRVLDPYGSAPRVFSVAVDITVQVRARREIEALALRLGASEARLAAVLDHIPTGVLLAEAPSGRIVLGNATAERIVGHPILPSSNVAEYAEWVAFHPDGRQVRGEEYALARALGGEIVRGAEYLYRRGDGVLSWIRVDGAPIRGADGQITGAVVAIVDVDQQRRSEEAFELLAEAGRVLASPLDLERTLRDVVRLVVGRMADWSSIYLLEDDGIRLAATAHVDPELESVLRTMFARYPLPADAPHGYPRVLRTGRAELLSDLDDVIRDRIRVDDEHRALLGRLAAVSALTVPLVANDRTFGALTFAASRSGRRYGPQDLAVAEELARRVAVTLENARLFEEARRARQRAEEASRSKDEFLATVSHELRTPLSAILGWAGMLRSGVPDEVRQRRGIEVIERNARAQAKLIEDILDAGRIISGKIALSLGPVALEPLVASAVDSLRPAAEKKGVALSLSLATSDVVVTGDPDRLRQVFDNLLSNALKFGRSGGRIDVRIVRAHRTARVEVEDDGIGIEPSFLPYVFDRFRQADGSTVRAHGGLGLGLAIVKSIVDLHEGTIRAESPGAGLGATFYVRLPLASSAAGPDPEEERAPEIDLGRVRLLVVDDAPDARELVAALVTARGGAVSSAASAAEGLVRLEADRPNVVVTDIGMPDEDGYTFLRRIRALPEGRTLPVVALTAYAGAEERQKALEAGFDAWLAKPVSARALFEVLDRLVDRAPR